MQHDQPHLTLVTFFFVHWWTIIYSLAIFFHSHSIPEPPLNHYYKLTSPQIQGTLFPFHFLFIHIFSSAPSVKSYSDIPEVNFEFRILSMLKSCIHTIHDICTNTFFFTQKTYEEYFQVHILAPSPGTRSLTQDYSSTISPQGAFFLPLGGS